MAAQPGHVTYPVGKQSGIQLSPVFSMVRMQPQFVHSKRGLSGMLEE